MKSRTPGEKNMKAKVFISYAVIIILLSSILFFTFDSFQKLTRSSDTLAQPNARIGLLHEIIFSIYHAESNIRSYSLNDQKEHLDTYFEELEKINGMVDSLYQLADGDVFITETIDSINIQLLNKTRLLDRFIEIKKLDQNSVFYEKALDEILQVTEEEKRLREVTHQSSVDTLVVDEPDYNSEEIRREKRNFFNRVRDFFTRSSEEEQESLSDEEQIAEETEAGEFIQQIKTDSIITVYRDTEELMAEIEATMNNVIQTMLARQQNIRRMENNVMLEDKEVMDKIWEYVTQLEDYESINALQEARQAHSTVNKTTDKIFITVVFSLFILLVFSWLFANDVNKSRFYKNQLLREKARAEELVQIKQRFMANISHEIRTPLNSIIGFSSQLKKEVIPAEFQTYAKAINQSSVHLLGIVNDILDFSKIEAGKIELNIKPLNLKDVASEVFDTLAVIAREKGLVFTMDINSLKHPYVKGDSLRIKQVLLNIASNALKFTHQGTVQMIFTDFVSEDQTEINYVHVKITDTGIGIAPGDQQRIFEEFAQSDNQASRNHGGTGLGLSISKKLVEHMGGNIELFSRKGEGSTFSVHIPLKIADAQEVAAEDNVDLPELDSQINILLIDDDKLNRLLFKSFFKPIRRTKLIEAENALEALKLLGEMSFDLVISDVQMPGMSGLELIRKLRSDPAALNAKTPFLACTADVTAETLKDIKESGMEDYLLKPVDEALLLKKIMGLIYQPRGNPPLTREETTVALSPGREAPKDKILYNIEGLQAFTGNDTESMKAVLKVFIGDTRKNLHKLEKILKTNKLTEMHLLEIKEVAHKMSNMFQLLKVEEANQHLRKLNSISEQKLSDHEIYENISGLLKTSAALTASLKIYLEPEN